MMLYENYIIMGTFDLGNGALNPEESFSKEHWLSSIGLASILAGGAKPIVPKPKTHSLQDRNLVLEKTVDKAHELTMKTKADVNFVVDGVRGGINIFLNGLHHHKNLEYSPSISVPKIPVKVMDTESVKKVLDRVWSKFFLSGVGKGTGNGSAKQSSLVGREVELGWPGDNYKAIEIEGTVKVGGKEMDISRRIDYDTFKRKLRNWAHYRLKGGIDSLPEGLR